MTDDLSQLFENAGVSLPNENSLGEEIVPLQRHRKIVEFLDLVWEQQNR